MKPGEAVLAQTTGEVQDLVARIYGELTKLSGQELSDLMHHTDTLRKESPSPSVRVAAFIVTDLCDSTLKERKAKKTS